VEICCRDDRQVIDAVGGKIIEAGGPDGESLPASVSPGGRGWDKRLTSSIHLPGNHGACPQVLGHQEIHPQSTLLRGDDSRVLLGETTREFVHRHPGSGMFLPLHPSLI
jgi:hypothetical protein